MSPRQPVRERRFNRLFLLYAATFALACWSAARLLHRMDVPDFAGRFGPRLPARALAAYLAAVAAFNALPWLVQVMGRDVGWVATMGGLAGGADVVLIAEFPVGLDEVVAHLRGRRAEGKDFSIVVVAEGVHLAGLQGGSGETDAFGHVRLSERGVGDALSRAIEAETGFESRVTVLGHLQRGGTPSTVDRIWAARLGARAAELAITGCSGVIPVRRDGDVAVVPLAGVRPQRRVPRELYELTRVLG